MKKVSDKTRVELLESHVNFLEEDINDFLESLHEDIDHEFFLVDCECLATNLDRFIIQCESWLYQLGETKESNKEKDIALEMAMNESESYKELEIEKLRAQLENYKDLSDTFLESINLMNRIRDNER